MSQEAQRILWVDDEAAITDLGRAILTRLGYEVEVTLQSQEALAMVQAAPQRFAALITDYTMPGLTGIELAAACRQLRADLPIILCTGERPAVYAARVAAYDIIAVLPKPFRPMELASTLRQVLTPRAPCRIP